MQQLNKLNKQLAVLNKVNNKQKLNDNVVDADYTVVMMTRNKKLVTNGTRLL